MQREIQYRGRRKDNNEWAYGYFFKHPDGASSIFIPGEGSFIVDPETVGQYTGLQDKAGVKIFEGDVVKTATGNVCEIRWCEVTELVWNEADYITDSFSYTGFAFFNFKLNKAFHLDVTNTIEVIGSIHTTPELI